MAILVRASFQMRELEERFITLGLNYRVVGGPRFYERKEIRDALAYLRLVAQPSDDLAFERIINVPKRGLGDSTVNMLTATARHQQVPLLSATRMMVETEDLKPKQRTTLRNLVSQFDNWAYRAESLPPYQLVEQVLEESGYMDMLAADKSVECRRGARRTSRNSVRAMEEFDTLGGFLEHISLVMDRDNADSERRRHDHDAALGQRARVRHGVPARLGGRHCSPASAPWTKAVAPASRKSGALPMWGSPAPASACASLAAQNRRINGLWQSAIPSRFIDELPPDAVSRSPIAARPMAATAMAAALIQPLRQGRRRSKASTKPPAGNAPAPSTKPAASRAGPMTIDGDLVAPARPTTAAARNTPSASASST
jgi:DNA helicase-2/ATP-dependent DNA helicase PcrA